MKNIYKKCTVCDRDFFPTKNNHVSCSSRCNSLKWKKNNPIKKKSYQEIYRTENKEKISEKSKVWRQNNADKRRMYQSKRRANKIDAVFKGICSEYYDFFMKEIYSLAKFRSEKTGIFCVVDHIVPLNNPIVCGLHHPLNLRVITNLDNSVKGNRLEDF